MRTRLLLVVATLVAGCAGPADVAGNYTINLTNGENGCSVDGWMVGEETTGVPIIVTQDEDQVQLDVNGPSGTFLDVFVGSSLFNGQVSGNDVTAALIGSVSARQGECAYTWTIDLAAEADGDVLRGDLLWHPVTNGHADCGILATCGNGQSFNGTRPPTE